MFKGRRDADTRYPDLSKSTLVHNNASAPCNCFANTLALLVNAIAFTKNAKVLPYELSYASNVSINVQHACGCM